MKTSHAHIIGIRVRSGDGSCRFRPSRPRPLPTPIPLIPPTRSSEIFLKQKDALKGRQDARPLRRHRGRLQETGSGWFAAPEFNLDLLGEFRIQLRPADAGCAGKSRTSSPRRSKIPASQAPNSRLTGTRTPSARKNTIWACPSAAPTPWFPTSPRIGIDRSLLVAKGFGKSKPRVANPYSPENRRVETHLSE